MAALKFCDVQPRKAVETRRRSPTAILLDGIGHQINLLKDPNYEVERVRYVKTEDGYKRAAIAKPPRKWWFKGDDGQFYVQLHLGSSTVVELQAGKPTLMCGTEKDVAGVLEQIAIMIRDGKFTDAITQAHGKMKRKKG